MSNVHFRSMYWYTLLIALTHLTVTGYIAKNKADIFFNFLTVKYVSKIDALVVIALACYAAFQIYRFTRLLIERRIENILDWLKLLAIECFLVIIYLGIHGGRLVSDQENTVWGALLLLIAFAELMFIPTSTKFYQQNVKK